MPGIDGCNHNLEEQSLELSLLLVGWSVFHLFCCCHWWFLLQIRAQSELLLRIRLVRMHSTLPSPPLCCIITVSLVHRSVFQLVAVVGVCLLLLLLVVVGDASMNACLNVPPSPLVVQEESH
jgi:hypothetical protein